MSNGEIERFPYLNHESPMDLFEVVNRKYDAGKEYVNALSVYNRLELGKKATLAKIMDHIKNTQVSPTTRGWGQEALSNAAQATAEWESYLEIINEAYHNMLDALNEKNTWESAFEAVRSYQSFVKEQIKHNL